MVMQNMINAPNPSVWTSFLTVITSTGTSPTVGSGTTIISSYLQLGKLLFVNIALSQTSEGTAGSGSYLFSIPSIFSINTSITGTYNSSSPFNLTCVGTTSAAISSSSTNVGTGSAVVFDSGHYLIFIVASGNSNYFANYNYFSLGNTSVSYSASLMIPIN